MIGGRYLRRRLTAAFVFVGGLLLLTAAVVAVNPSSASRAPTRPPTASFPPPAAGYFGLRPGGNWASLPSGAECAPQVPYLTAGPGPEDSQPNNSPPAPVPKAPPFPGRRPTHGA